MMLSRLVGNRLRPVRLEQAGQFIGGLLLALDDLLFVAIDRVRLQQVLLVVGRGTTPPRARPPPRRRREWSAPASQVAGWSRRSRAPVHQRRGPISRCAYQRLRARARMARLGKLRFTISTVRSTSGGSSSVTTSSLACSAPAARRTSGRVGSPKYTLVPKRRTTSTWPGLRSSAVNSMPCIRSTRPMI